MVFLRKILNDFLSLLMAKENVVKTGFCVIIGTCLSDVRVFIMGLNKT